MRGTHAGFVPCRFSKWNVVILLGIALVGCRQAPPSPVTLNYPHGWSYRPDELAARAELSRQFSRATGIQVRDIPTPESTYDQLELYRRLLRQGSSGADLLGIDPIWSDLLEPDLIDLKPYLPAEISSVMAQLPPSYTVNKKLVALPYQVNIGSLEYRGDLLREYGYDHPPRTWDELERMASRIQTGERAKGRKDFWGYVWQGAEAEALACNALEWQFSAGGGRIIESDRTVSVNNPAAIRSWQRARHWIGWISPPSVVVYRERDSTNFFDSGKAAFDRVWLGTSVAGSGPSTQVHWRGTAPPANTAFAALPGGPGGSAGTMGGSGLGVPRGSAHPQEAVKLISFLFHSQIESIEKRIGAPGVQPAFFSPPDRSLQSEKLIQLENVVQRPAIEAGSQYTQVSRAYVAAVHAVLTGQKKAPDAAAELEKRLIQMTGFPKGVPSRVDGLP